MQVTQWSCAFSSHGLDNYRLLKGFPEVWFEDFGEVKGRDFYGRFPAFREIVPRNNLSPYQMSFRC